MKKYSLYILIYIMLCAQTQSAAGAVIADGLLMELSSINTDGAWTAAGDRADGDTLWVDLATADGSQNASLDSFAGPHGFADMFTICSEVLVTRPPGSPIIVLSGLGNPVGVRPR